MNPLLKEFFAVTAQRELAKSLTEKTLKQGRNAAVDALKQDVANGYMEQYQLDEAITEIDERLDKVKELLISDALMDRIEEDTAAVISEHISDDMLKKIIDFYKSEDGKAIEAALCRITGFLDDIAIARSKEALKEHGLGPEIF